MEENYSNMVYGDQEFKSFEEIFNYGLSLCKWNKKKQAKDFFTAYIHYLYNVNTRKDVPTIEYAEQCAKKNFGYFAGYYGDDVRKKVHDYFEAVHPVFGDRYNVTAKEAFYAGVQIAEVREKEKRMAMTDEQIKQNAEYFATHLNGQPCPFSSREYEAHMAGAHSRDNEIGMLQRQIEELSEQLKMNAENIQKLRRPWVEVNKLPEENPDEKGYSVEVIGLFPDGSVSKCSCSIEEGIWFIEGLTCDKPTHWMPMPKV